MIIPSFFLVSHGWQRLSFGLFFHHILLKIMDDFNDRIWWTIFFLKWCYDEPQRNAHERMNMNIWAYFNIHKVVIQWKWKWLLQNALQYTCPIKKIWTQEPSICSGQLNRVYEPTNIVSLANLTLFNDNSEKRNGSQFPELKMKMYELRLIVRDSFFGA